MEEARLTLDGGLDGSDGNLGGSSTDAGRSVHSGAGDGGKSGGILSGSESGAAGSAHGGALDDRHDDEERVEKYCKECAGGPSRHHLSQCHREEFCY